VTNAELFLATMQKTVGHTGMVETYRRAVVSQWGGPEVIRLIDAALPQPDPHHVRIRTLAAGVPYADLLMREGLHPEVWFERLSFTPSTSEFSLQYPGWFWFWEVRIDSYGSASDCQCYHERLIRRADDDSRACSPADVDEAIGGCVCCLNADVSASRERTSGH
jgi:hypothetical protein